MGKGRYQEKEEGKLKEKEKRKARSKGLEEAKSEFGVKSERRNRCSRGEVKKGVGERVGERKEKRQKK